MGENTLLSNSATNFLFFNKPLSSLCGYKTGGNALIYAEPNSLKTLCECIDYIKSKGLPYKIIGNGTNLLISDKGYNGAVISLKKISGIEYYKGGEIKAHAGTNLSTLIDFCANNGFTGLEPLSGIPATVGGAVAMNAGAFLTCISDRVTVVEAIRKGRLIRYDKSLCRFSYRKSRFLTSSDVIVSVRFLFGKDKGNNILQKKEEYLVIRKKLQPFGRTCGSVFKNPKGYYAGELIERATLKGVRIGGAQISNKHANFIVAKEGCTSNDIYRLINLVKFEVFKRYGVKLIEEIEYLGEF